MLERKARHVAHPGESARAGEARRMLVVDADPDVRAALCLVLSRERCLCVVGQAADLEEFLASAALLQPDLVLLDWELAGLQDGATLRQVRATCPHTAFVALSVRAERRRDVLAVGIDLFVSKMDPPGRLLAAVRAAVASPRRS